MKKIKEAAALDEVSAFRLELLLITTEEKELQRMEKYWVLQKDLANKKNEQAVEEFLLHLKLLNRSERTIIKYRRFLERFFAEIEEPYTILPPDRILAWFQTHQRHVKVVTYRDRLDILSSFYNFCVRESLIEFSPIKRRWFPRLPKSLPKYIEREDVAKIRVASERIGIRNQALVEFLLTSGCRVGEVRMLTIGDTDLENRTARVLGKGKKIRNVHFTERCAVLLERYIDTRINQNRTDPLFATLRKETPMGESTIQGILKQLGKSVGMSTSLHPHRFRHTFATELLAKGAELSFIADEMGHNDQATTQIYARLPTREIIRHYRRYMG